MRTAIIIGYSYKEKRYFEDESLSPLPGICIDLYQIYALVLKMKCDRIVIMTDIDKDEKTENVIAAVIAGIVDSGILSFIEKVKDQEQYFKIESYKNFKDVFSTYLEDSNEVFIYYTGHLFNNKIMLPGKAFEVTLIDTDKQNSSDISLDEVGMLISEKTNKNAEIFIIMDCCNGTGMNLRYKLDNGVYRLTKKGQLFSQKILCVSSTESDQTSGATKDGSIFTRFFIQNMGEEKSLNSLLIRTNTECSSRHSQTAGIYSSFPNIKKIWPWVLGSVINIFADYYLKYLKIDFTTKNFQ